jgi:hypothetical protein
MTHTGLAGTWRLVSCEAEGDDGGIAYPQGEDAVGLLVYTTDGFMSGQVMRRGRESLPAGYRQGGASGRVQNAFEGYIAYCGRYRVDESAGEVIHTVEAALYPNWVGTEQRRTYHIDGNRLTLLAVSERGGKKKVARLIWERVGS